MKQDNPRTESTPATERLRSFQEAMRRLRTRERGTTLVEVLIVVAIIAMVAGGVAFFAFPKFKESQVKAATTGARVIRGAAQNWQMTNDGCPTISQLIQDKQLDKAQDTNDPWGGDYTITC